MDKTPEEMRARIDEIDAIIAPLEQERAELAQALVEATCPYAVGDILERTFRWGYDNPPVYRTERVKVTSMYPSSWSDSPRLKGRTVKKDGTLGKHSKDLYQSDWKKVEPTRAGSGEH